MDELGHDNSSHTTACYALDKSANSYQGDAFYEGQKRPGDNDDISYEEGFHPSQR